MINLATYMIIQRSINMLFVEYVVISSLKKEKDVLLVNLYFQGAQYVVD